MQAIYHTSVDELTLTFLENLKTQFKHCKVDIIVKDSDETDYLNSSKKNKKYLEDAIKEVNSTKLINKSIEDLDL